MKTYLVCLLVVFSLILAGCGSGGGGNADLKGLITGNVSDSAGRPVVNAVITTDKGRSQSFSTQQGIYRLDNVPNGYRTVYADITIDGIPYHGQNITNLIVDNISSQSASVNISISPTDQQGRFVGFITDSGGNPLQNARVFAASNSELSGATTFTDSHGHYILNGLESGVTYLVTASAQGYENASNNTHSVTAGGTTTLSFTLQNSTNPALSPPTGLFAVAYTVPEDPTRAPKGFAKKKAYDSIKAYLSHRAQSEHKSLTTRQTPAGSLIEIDLTWNFASSPGLMGYGIFRGFDVNQITALDFLRDPLANFYADQDTVLTPGTTTYYQVNSLNTDYPDTPGSSSSRSPVVSANPLPPFYVVNVNSSTMNFSWQTVLGASNYQILVYPIYPDYNVNPTLDTTVGNQSSYHYNGPALTSGKTYWLVMVALGHYDGTRYTSRSFSGIYGFTAP